MERSRGNGRKLKFHKVRRKTKTGRRKWVREGTTKERKGFTQVRLRVVLYEVTGGLKECGPAHTERVFLGVMIGACWGRLGWQGRGRSLRHDKAKADTALLRPSLHEGFGYAKKRQVPLC